MVQRLVLCAGVIGLALSVNAQTTINLRGKIANKAGKPIAGAIIALAGQSLKDTSGTDGAFVISTATAAKMPLLIPEGESIIMNNGGLAFSLPKPSSVKIQMFDINGTLLKKDVLSNVSTGFYRFNITENRATSKLLIVKATVGQTEMTFRYLPLSNGNYAGGYSADNSSRSVTSKLGKITAVSDTLKVTATGYTAKSVAIVSYDQQLDITLDTLGGGGGLGSAGCGKTVGTFNTSGMNTVKSSGTDRKFRINIPTNYDVNKPYRLIFGMHCMGGDADKVAGTTDQTKNFYGIKPLAEKDNIQCIYVAPQGDAGGTWNPTKDPIFFFDLQKYLKDNMCIDTSRVFSVGFSFGAMFTYALSLKYPNVLRAVACNAPANWHFDPQPTNNHIPIAYIQTTGIADGTCNWIFSDGQKQGGKWCLLQHGEDNGCTTTIADVKITTNGTHLVTDFKGCKEGYPVKFLSHNGDHVANKTDQGSNVDWIPVEFWNFFKQF